MRFGISTMIVIAGYLGRKTHIVGTLTPLFVSASLFPLEPIDKITIPRVQEPSPYRRNRRPHRTREKARELFQGLRAPYPRGCVIMKVVAFEMRVVSPEVARFGVGRKFLDFVTPAASPHKVRTWENYAICLDGHHGAVCSESSLPRHV